MNNNEEIIDDVLDEGTSNIPPKDEKNSVFKMPSEITQLYDKSVENINTSNIKEEEIQDQTNITVGKEVVPIVANNVVTENNESSVVAPIDAVSTDTATTQEKLPVVEENKVIPTPENQSVTPSIDSTLPIVENSEKKEEPVKKKGKVGKIILLIFLLIISLGALAVYLVGIDTILKFVKQFI